MPIFVNHLGGKGDVGGDHQVASLKFFHDFGIRYIKSISDLDGRKRGRRLGVVGQ